jgi:hypothetical protein
MSCHVQSCIHPSSELWHSIEWWVVTVLRRAALLSFSGFVSISTETSVMASPCGSIPQRTTVCIFTAVETSSHVRNLDPLINDIFCVLVPCGISEQWSERLIARGLQLA